MTDHRDLFDAAKRVACADLAAAAGVALRRVGGRLVGPCPLCGGDAKSGRFSVTLKSNLWHCFACGEGGSAIDLEIALGGPGEGDVSPALAAARRLAGGGFTPLPHTSRTAAAPSPPPRSTASMAISFWRAARPARGTIVEAWLRRRGLDPARLGRALDRLRFHPDAFAAGERQGGRLIWERRAPAMLAPIVDTASTDKARAGKGRLIGVHATYLTRDGTDKALMIAPDGAPIPARKMWGKAQGGACPLTPLDPAAPGLEGAPLYVGEGVETTLTALHMAHPSPARAAAVLSLTNLQGGYRKDEDGAATHWPPKADRAAPPWTHPNAGAVIVIVDRDMAPIRLKRRDEMGTVRLMLLDAEARAQLCADLAIQHWRAAGASSVAALLPARAGCDLNDMVKDNGR